MIDKITVISAILTTILVIQGGGCIQDDPNRQAAQANLLEIQDALKRFYDDMGRHPTDSEDLMILIEDPHMEGWGGPYLIHHQLMDPWEHPYHYGFARDIIFIASVGPNGQPETTRLDLNQGLSRGDDIILMIPNQKP